MLRLAFLLLVLPVAACSGGGSGADDVPALDFAGIDTVSDAVPEADLPSDVPVADLPPPGEVAAPDAEGADLPEADDGEGPANEPPGFDALAPLTLKMGHVTTLDVGDAIDDAEDADAALILSWSSQHVALADDGSHVLTVVAPTDWFGDETIELVVTDTAGAGASAFLKVTVQEVVPPEPPAECPTTLFSYAAAEGTAEVLLSGTFNAWAGVGASQLKLADPDGDHTWTLEVALAGGHYLYKFIVDGAWVHDPANPNTVDDGYGGKNSVLDVPACPASPEPGQGEE
jgi:hypothetical protein